MRDIDYTKCSKVTYSKKKAALGALNYFRKNPALASPTRVYKCPECRKWHITSQK